MTAAVLLASCADSVKDAGSGDGYPLLATVPERPKRIWSPAEIDETIRALTAARHSAEQAAAAVEAAKPATATGPGS